MKKLIALFAVLGFATSVSAADGADFSHSGEFRLQYKNDMNVDYDDDGADSPDQTWHQRLRWGTTVRAGEKLTGSFTLVHNADWGSNPDQVPDTIEKGVTGDAETNNVLLVNEAFISWVANDAWALKFGRGTFTMADGRFVSSNEYDDVLRAFDGVLASWDHESARVSFFAVQGAKALDAANFNDFGIFFGASVDFKSLPDWLKTANLHVVQVKRDEGDYFGGTLPGTGLGEQENLKAGVVLTGETSGVDFRVNYEMESGEDTAVGGATKTDIKTSMIDAEVGYAIDWWGTRFHVGYHTDTGTSASASDDETYDGFHYDRHNNAGLMDILGWGNLTYLRAGASMKPSDEITVGLEYFIFTQTEKDGGIVDHDGGVRSNAVTGAPAADAATNEDELGTEIDVWVTKKYTSNFSITGRYGIFAPGDEFGTNADDRSQVYVEAKLTF